MYVCTKQSTSPTCHGFLLVQNSHEVDLDFYHFSVPRAKVPNQNFATNAGNLLSVKNSEKEQTLGEVFAIVK